MVNRVPGNFHVEAGSVNHNLNPTMTNLSHTVHHLSFGLPPTRSTRAERKVRERENPHEPTLPFATGANPANSNLAFSETNIFRAAPR